MSLGIHSEVEMSEGANLTFIYHFNLDEPLARNPKDCRLPCLIIPYSLTPLIPIP
jgi:hypothetical protein